MATVSALDLREQVIKKYIPLVKYIASRVIIGKTKYIEFDDLVGYGMLGLMDALSKFDEEKGMKFSTYASIRIRGSMIDEIRRISPISKGAMDKLNRYNEAVEGLQKSLMREPNNEEIAKALGVSLGDVTEVEKYINYISVASLEDLIFSNDEDMTLITTIEDRNSPSPEKAMEEKEELEILVKAIDLLNEKDKLVVSLYYYEELTLKEIGKILEVSESRVCQIHSRAIINLKKAIKKLKYD
ncbi:FliA/WhiG family RNA polymerase sigma factor [Clostridium frigidicarnis]|uniref:RNA polymerase, sigma 28 subunit, SigD/FliA/WhiG n=1 Tax=Clostridium frigidicarnis TaxID=84698 RepID=A0A1I0VG36_9CLOT|nr:FliA/WhiG family RNA polymerase sigma factor [Clostridium frigidicarnis]SFA75007.1 RNA polymerase, sigma 28 subunit, SigD/FliA/WhiG [Clostridium frigidicarnis]